MKNTRFQDFAVELETAGRTFMRTIRSGARTVAALPWPALLVAAFLLAFLITIVPLALMLFIGFLLFKFVASALFGRRPRRLRG